MRKITDSYRYLNEEELYAKDGKLLCPEMDFFQEEEKERILGGAMERIQQETVEPTDEGQRLFTKKTISILILAAALFTTLTASAAGYFQLKKELADSLDITSDISAEQLSSMVTDFSEKEVSVTEYGVTIRAEQAISNGRSACICFEIELPEGIFRENSDGGLYTQGICTYRNGPVSWSSDCTDGYVDIFNKWQNVKLWIGGEAVGCGPMIIERSTEDSDQYYVVEMIGLEQEMGSLEGAQEMKLVLTNLGYVYADHDKTEWTTQIEGTWTLEWTMGFKDTSRIYEVQKQVQNGERNVFVQTVQISPLGIQLTGTTDDDGVGGDFLNPDYIITREGSVDIVSVWAVGEEDGTATAEGEFEKLMEVDDITGVRINGEDWIFRE